jgi:hypothetical protein
MDLPQEATCKKRIKGETERAPKLVSDMEMIGNRFCTLWVLSRQDTSPSKENDND